MAYSLAGERPAIMAWPTALVALLLRPLARALKARRQRVALTTLLEMDEYRLWDLGVARADLEAALRSDDFDPEAIWAGDRRIDVSPPR